MKSSRKKTSSQLSSRKTLTRAIANHFQLSIGQQIGVLAPQSVLNSRVDHQSSVPITRDLRNRETYNDWDAREKDPNAGRLSLVFFVVLLSNSSSSSSRLPRQIWSEYESENKFRWSRKAFFARIFRDILIYDSPWKKIVFFLLKN